MSSSFDLWKPYLTLFGGFLVHITLGTLYTFGNMNPYIYSYYRTHHAPAFDPADTVWIFALTCFAQGACMSLGGVLKRYVGVRITVLTGGWLMSLGVALTYFTVKVNLWATVMTYGVLFGFGIAIAYSVAIATAMEWFPKRRGVVGGVVVAGFGGGAFIFNFVQTFYINPLNLEANSTDSSGQKTDSSYFYDSDLLDRVPSCFLLLGGIYAIMQLVGVLCIWEAPKPTDEVMPIMKGNDDDDNTSRVYQIQSSGIKESMTPEEALRSHKFWILWSTFFFNGLGTVVISTLYKSYGTTFIHDDHFLSAVGSVSSILNAVGRIAWGLLHDRFPYKILMSIQSGLLGILLMSFYYTKDMGEVAFLVWVCALFGILSGSFALFPAITIKTFGPDHMATIYGLVFTSNAISGVLTAFLLSSLQASIGWLGVFGMGAASAAMSLILTLFF